MIINCGHWNKKQSHTSQTQQTAILLMRLSSGETRAVRPDRTSCSCSAFRRRYTRVFDEKRLIVLTNLRSHRLAVFTNEPLMSSGDHTSGDCRGWVLSPPWHNIKRWWDQAGVSGQWEASYGSIWPIRCRPQSSERVSSAGAKFKQYLITGNDYLNLIPP